jgi:hypothetical protein
MSELMPTISRKARRGALVEAPQPQVFDDPNGATFLAAILELAFHLKADFHNL